MIKKIVEASRAAARAFQQKYNDQGEELPDPTPIEVPLGFKKPPTIQEQIAQFIRTPQFREQLARQMGQNPDEVESFDEANDFEVGDEEFDDVPTRHEMEEELVNQAKRDADNFVAESRKKRSQKKEEVKDSEKKDDVKPKDETDHKDSGSA